ncbi:MAG TPA: hypothetical protein VJT73_21560 [Polyangiaceae bacterium]|nr:hypothetical protein [Polyangiaceae bacterium]
MAKDGLLPLFLALLVSSWPRYAAADLGADADRLAERWSKSGVRAERLPPVFLEHGRAKLVRLPESAFGPEAGCTTVAFLTSRSTDFAVKIEPLVSAKHHASSGKVERSVAGSVVVSECGSSRAALMRLVVEVRVARAAVETVMALGDGPAPPVADMLPERASGPSAPLADPGPRSQTEPLMARVKHAELRARNAGAERVQLQSFRAEPDGSGREVIRLEEGCHRLEIFADLVGRRPFDVDAELRDTSTERLMARDRSDAADARLETCAGSSMTGDLLYAGAPGPASVLMLDTMFALPRGVPTIWGARVRAGLSGALHRRKLPITDGEPIEQRLGASGVTSFPIPVEPGACYVAALATLRGDPRSITLSARLDTRVAFDASSGLTDGAAVAFCSAGADKARLEVEVRGNAVAWLIAIWPVGFRTFDEGR